MSVSASPNYGVVSAAASTTGLLLNSTNILSVIFAPTSFLPLTSFRAKTDGVAQRATGSTQSPLSYVNLSNDQWHTGHPITGANYEIYFDSLTNSAFGSAGTWFGSPRDSFVGLGSERTWTWQKDTTTAGFAIHVILIEIRNIATPSITTGTASFTFTSEISF